MLDSYVFAIMSPRNKKLNFFGVGLHCDVLQSRRNSLKCQNQGENEVNLREIQPSLS